MNRCRDPQVQCQSAHPRSGEISRGSGGGGRRRGFLLVRDYRPVIDVGWDEVVECVEAESRWFDRPSGSVAAAKFDAVLDGQPAAAAEGIGIRLHMCRRFASPRSRTTCGCSLTTPSWPGAVWRQTMIGTTAE